MPGIIDSFWIALGYKVDNSGLDDMKRKADAAKESMLSVGGAIASIVAGFAIHKIAEIGSTFEQNTNLIAGSLAALGFSSDFNAGLKEAEKTLQSITAAAATLPGEAEDYIQVFQAGLPYLKAGMPGANVGQITEFTNKLTAVAKSVAKGMDSAQIARESSQLLATQGRAGGHNVLWQKLLPFIMQVKGAADVTAQSFNAMTQPKRVELLAAAFAKLQPLIDAQASSFDAMWGAAVSGAKQLLRIGTEPIFKGMKVALDQMNALFVDQKGNLTELGASVTGTAKKVGSFLVNVIAMGAKLVGWFASSSAGATILKGSLLAVGSLIAGLASEKAALGILKLVLAFKNLKGVLTGGVFGLILLLAEDLYVFAKGGNSVSGMLYNKFKPAIALIIGPLALLLFGFLKLNGAFTLLNATLGLAKAGFFQLIAPMLRVGLLWATLNLPLLATLGTVLLVVGALGLVIFAAYELWKHWDEVMANMTEGWQRFLSALKSGPHDIAVALGFAGTKDEQVAQAQKQAAFGAGSGVSAPGADVIWKNPSTGLEETHRAGWQPPSASMSGAEANAPTATAGAAKAAGTTSQTTNVGTVNIITNDPAVMKKEWDKHIRDGQSQVAY